MQRRAIERLEGERDRLERLLLRLPSLMGELDVGKLAQGVVEAAVELSGARFGAFAAADSDEETVVFVGATGPPPAFAETPALKAAPLLAGAIWSGEAVRVDDVTAWASRDESARAYGVFADGRLVRSWLAVPVRGRGGAVLGAIYLGHHRAHAFSGRQHELVGGLCSQLGVAMENAELFAERGRIVATLQKSLLPPLLPDIPGVDLAARYRPTGATNLVGGDFFDVFEMADDRTWGLILGDVSGFGAEAAALTGIARYTVRAIAGPGDKPSDVLAQLNEAMLHQGPAERFCTALYALATLPSAAEGTGGGVEVRLANGGHPPGLVLRDDESVERLEEGAGILLGVFSDPVFADEQVTLRPGDALVLYTDGVIEARDLTGTQFGEDRLAAVLATCAGRSADGIARRVELAALDHQGNQPSDDIAIVVLRARPTAHPAS
ncbi:MAG TPA: GAF domain-containing SpoIIE family protein phosphatase [Actinomycetota bacterium]